MHLTVVPRPRHARNISQGGEAIGSADIVFHVSLHIAQTPVRVLGDDTISLCTSDLLNTAFCLESHAAFCQVGIYPSVFALTAQSDTSRIPRHSSPSRLAVNQYPSPSPSFQTTPTCGSKVPRCGTGITGMQPIIGCSSAVLCFRSGSLHNCKSLNGACTHDVSNMDAGSLLPMSWI
jgi:hypothetical protein